MKLHPSFALAAALLLPGCDPADNSAAPAPATVDEAKALDQAAEMIEGQPLPATPPANPGRPAPD